MAQAGAMTDVTQRLFVELKSKNEEARARAAYELYDNVLSVSRGTATILDFRLCLIWLML
jgi:FKBP12-rapamycin complex-associated protein